MSHRRDHQILAGSGVVAVVCAVCFVASLNTELQRPVPSTLVVDRHNVPLTEVEGGDEDDRFGYWPLPYVLPLRLVVATLQTEDRHFYEHAGVHASSILRAMKQNLESGRVISGASTIPMQVARMQSGRPRNLISKLQEATEAWVLTADHGHDALLRHYLTLAPYGARVHGAARAARFYFDKPVEDLSWLQAAWLAGLPQQPTRMSPFNDDGRRRGLARARRILTALHQQGYLDDHDLQVAVDSDLGIVDRRPRPGSALHYALLLTDDVKAARRSDPQLTLVRSSLDLEVQETATAIVRRNLDSVRYLGATNSAAIVLDTETGEVRGWVGSVDYFDKEAHGAIDFNRVKRSPGSTLKPFLYGLALDTGTSTTSQQRYTAASPLADVPMDVVDENGRSYLPKNINKSFLGPMSLREALGNSRNIPALRVLGDVGVDRLLELLDDGGVDDVSFEPGRYGLGLAIGNLHTTPEELARLYLALQNGGETKALRFSDVDVTAAAPRRLLARDAAALVTDIIADDSARRPSFPQGSALDFDIAVAIKTGTSQGFRDGWTVAFTDRLLVVVWVGNHDWRRMNHLGGLAGTAEAAHELIEALSPSWKRHVPLPQAFAPPPDSEQRVVCALSGQLAGAECPHHRTEHFLGRLQGKKLLAGTAPTESCDWHRRVAVDVRTGDLATARCPTHVVERRSVTALPPTYQRWARQKRLTLAPTKASRLCGGEVESAVVEVVLTEPRDGVRYTFDPDTPPEYATVRLAADVEGGVDEEVVFLVDGTPVATAGFPFEARWTLTPGRHTIQAALVRRPSTSSPATILVRR